MKSCFLTLLCFASVLTYAGEFLPFDSRWDYPQYIGYRPANESVVNVNPPRFSWPFTPGTLAERDDTLPETDFTLQISTHPDFANPEVNRTERWNFINDLAPLAVGHWYWRVGYAKPGEAPYQWSAIREFTIDDQTPKWDRSELGSVLATHPRVGPADGDWASFRQSIEADPELSTIWTRIQADGEAILKKAWWSDFPKSDATKSGNKKERRAVNRKFMEIGEDFVTAGFIYRVTGDERYQRVLDYAQVVASFEPGGETSPEYNGASDKWGSRWSLYLAQIYDWFVTDLSREQAEVLRKGAAWRVEAIVGNKLSWNGPKGVHTSGSGVFQQSHPFENMMTATEASLLLAGDDESIDDWMPLLLSYFTGIGGGHGPDEGWNEAGGYAYFKTAHAFDVYLTAVMACPDINLQQSPWFTHLTDFLLDLTPPGAGRQGYGDYTQDLSSGQRKGDLLKMLMSATVITQDGKFRRAWEQLAEEGIRPRKMDECLFLVAAERQGLPESGGSHTTSTLYPTAGWVFAGTFDPSQRDSAVTGTRITVMARPKGGYSHSYAHDGAFVWQAYGETLAAGGGATVYADLFARHTLSHNGILVNGKGAELRDFYSPNPYAARPLYWDSTPEYTAWSVDLTGSYLADPASPLQHRMTLDLPGEWGAPELAYWRRHFALVGTDALVIYDELGIRPDADEGRFTWLYHFPMGSEPNLIEEDGLIRLSYQVKAVNASLWQRANVATEVSLAEGRETLINPVTETDYLPAVMKAYKRREHERTWEDWTGDRLAVTTASVRQANFLTVLLASREGEVQETVEFQDDNTVVIHSEAGDRTVSFNGYSNADVSLDVPAIAAFAEQSEPYHLPAHGERASINIGEKSLDVDWLRHDTFQGADWQNRWFVENQYALVRSTDEGLAVSQPAGEKGGGTTVWLRAPLPDSYIIRVQARTLEKDSFNACNLNAFLNATEADGTPLKFNRGGDYPEYHSANNYIVTFTGGSMEGWNRLRRDPGFQLIEQSPIRTEPGKSYELIYLMRKGHLQTFVNGRLIHDWTDLDPLPSGRFGLRTWSSDIVWESVDIGVPANEDPLAVYK